MSPQTAVAGSSGNSSNTPPNCPLTRRSNGSRSTNATKAHSPSPLPSLTPVFDVLTFGAVGDGVADDTEAFVNA
ncbi:hypothetical protein HPP92_001067 [Vanilla planifolia]|uniref:Polygalacturonase n=1 Tax=Vanilla planifolia TaxID=51239 RepID=A0A835VL16_VANPL|nr:hypothetical protein HPP92_001067 [Vanilla planifolia]